MFATLSEAGIRVKMVSTSEIKISCVVDREVALKAVRRLHTAFGLDQTEGKEPVLQGVAARELILIGSLFS